MALRLSRALGRSLESWLAMQDNHDLWQARQTVDLDAVERIDLRAASSLRKRTIPDSSATGESAHVVAASEKT
jgi:plasmid maintenance system antidote protein VapI